MSVVSGTAYAGMLVAMVTAGAFSAVVLTARAMAAVLRTSWAVVAAR